MSTPEPLASLEALLSRANQEREARQAPAGPGRQPVHTVYGGAHLFQADVARRLGVRARQAMDAYAADPPALGAVLGASPGLAARVHERVRARLETAPVEDYRIDFEDGYGVRGDAEEDRHAAEAARQVAAGAAAGSLPPRIGLRIKPLGEETRRRAARTLGRFLDALVAEAGGLPANGLVVTLPKVTVPEQPAYLAALLHEAEHRHGLSRGSLRIELMVETPDALLGAAGRAALPRLVEAGGGRVEAAHFGAYDYTAALGVTAAAQRLQHPACDWARAAMQVQLAGTGVWLSDGATTQLPAPLHRQPATPREHEENRTAVRAGWRAHVEDVRHALEAGFYQGWDLHPAQLVSRYAAVYAFFLEAAPAAADRLRHFLERAARASRVGTAFDDAATGQGLLTFFRRGLGCGALDAAEMEASTGLAAAELATRSFAALTRERTSG